MTKEQELILKLKKVLKTSCPPLCSHEGCNIIFRTGPYSGDYQKYEKEREEALNEEL